VLKQLGYKAMGKVSRQLGVLRQLFCAIRAFGG
jgi:hypothetical protein